MDEPDATPDVVTVSGTDGTPDTEVKMLEGATGARIPTGEHRRSGAMPAPDTAEDQGGNALAIVGVAIVALALIVILVLLVR